MKKTIFISVCVLALFICGCSTTDPTTTTTTTTISASDLASFVSSAKNMSNVTIATGTTVSFTDATASNVSTSTGSFYLAFSAPTAIRDAIQQLPNANMYQVDTSSSGSSSSSSSISGTTFTVRVGITITAASGYVFASDIVSGTDNVITYTGAGTATD